MDVWKHFAADAAQLMSVGEYFKNKTIFAPFS